MRPLFGLFRGAPLKSETTCVNQLLILFQKCRRTLSVRASMHHANSLTTQPSKFQGVFFCRFSTVWQNSSSMSVLAFCPLPAKSTQGRGSTDRMPEAFPNLIPSVHRAQRALGMFRAAAMLCLRASVFRQSERRILEEDEKSREHCLAAGWHQRDHS